MFSDLPLKKIISGAQTGADTAALDWAMAKGLQHGGWCPKGRRCESGRIDSKYQLEETNGSGYLERTERNVVESDATIIFTMADKLTGGSLRTEGFARSRGKPCMHFRPGVHPKFIRSFLVAHRVCCLNVAGSRASTDARIVEFVANSLAAAFETPTS